MACEQCRQQVASGTLSTAVAYTHDPMMCVHASHAPMLTLFTSHPGDDVPVGCLHHCQRRSVAAAHGSRGRAAADPSGVGYTQKAALHDGAGGSLQDPQGQGAAGTAEVSGVTPGALTAPTAMAVARCPLVPPAPAMPCSISH